MLETVLLDAVLLDIALLDFRLLDVIAALLLIAELLAIELVVLGGFEPPLLPQASRIELRLTRLRYLAVRVTDIGKFHSLRIGDQGDVRLSLVRLRSRWLYFAARN